MAGERRPTHFVLARCATLPRYIEQTDRQFCRRGASLGGRKDRDQTTRAVKWVNTLLSLDACSPAWSFTEAVCLSKTSSLTDERHLLIPDPIFHDDRNDLPRFVESVFPHKTYPFLYGSIPQTWESPNFEHDFTGEPGDNDPMDLFDIGQE